MSGRLLSRVLVGVAIGLILMGARALTAHAAETVLLASANHVSGDRCANVDVGRSRAFSVLTQYTGLSAATNITVYAFPRTTTGVVMEGGNGVSPALSLKYSNGPTNWTVHKWTTDGIELWRLCSRLSVDTNKVGEATLHTEPIPNPPTAAAIAAALTNPLPVTVAGGIANPLPVTCTGCSGGGGDEPQAISGTVALSDADRERLDLGWWGTWAVVGTLLVLMVAPALLSAMRVTRGM